MGFGERLGTWRAAIPPILLGLAALLVATLIPGAGASAPQHDWLLCRPHAACRPIDVSKLALTEPTSVLKTVYSAPRPRLERPLAVHVRAMASAEIYWNGALIGRNGVVGESRAQEVPGRFDAVFSVAPELVRPGPNLVTVRLSAHHLWAPVARPVHRLSIGPHDDGFRRIFVHYLPTLIIIGLLLAAFAANLLLRLVRGAGTTIFAILAGTVVLQAAIETSKLVLAYPYHWQLARLFALAVLAALAGLLLAFAALAWIPERRTRAAVIALVVTGLAGAWLLPPWDAKALWGFRAGIFGTLIAAAIGMTRAAPYARPAAIGCILVLALSGIPAFLDSGYYLAFVALFACQVLLAVRALRPAERIISAQPALPAGARLILIPNGGSRQCVAVRDILYARADDDYSIVHLDDGRQLLATVNLAALLRLAPDCLLRIHRSHAVNPGKVEALHRSGKLGRTVELVGGTRLPIGRTYRQAAASRLAQGGPCGHE